MYWEYNYDKGAVFSTTWFRAPNQYDGGEICWGTSANAANPPLHQGPFLFANALFSEHLNRLPYYNKEKTDYSTRRREIKIDGSIVSAPDTGAQAVALISQAEFPGAFLQLLAAGAPLLPAAEGLPPAMAIPLIEAAYNGIQGYVTPALSCRRCWFIARSNNPKEPGIGLVLGQLDPSTLSPQ